MPKKIIIISFLIAFSFKVNAQQTDSDLIQYVIQKLRIDLNDEEGSLYTLEETIPYEKNMSVVLIANPADEKEHECSRTFYDSYIVLVNNKTFNIEATYFESHETSLWVSDAVFIYDFEFDFSPYKLHDEKRAFGIKAKFRNMSSPSPMSSEALSLFVKEGNNLKLVLDNYEISLHFAEWNMQCTGWLEEKTKTLCISKNKTLDYFNIISESTLTETKSYEENGDCLEIEKVTKGKTEVLKYNGTNYTFEYE